MIKALSGKHRVSPNIDVSVVKNDKEYFRVELIRNWRQKNNLKKLHRPQKYLWELVWSIHKFLLEKQN